MMRRIKWPKRTFLAMIALLPVLIATFCPQFCHASGYLKTCIPSGNFYICFVDLADEPACPFGISHADAVRCGRILEDVLEVFRSYGFRDPAGEKVEVKDVADPVAIADLLWIPPFDYYVDVWIELPPDYVTREDTLIHELFHTVQYAYPGSYEPVEGSQYGDWVLEGQATMMEDLTFLDLDLLRAPSDLGWAESYLRNTDVRLWDLSYKACLFWTYFTEQVGHYNVEPGYGRDAMCAFWSRSSDIYGGIATIEKVLSDYYDGGYTPYRNFEALWKGFIVANYKKNLDNARPRDRYVDEQQYEAHHGQGSVWYQHWDELEETKQFPTVHFTVDSDFGSYDAPISGEAHMNDWAAHYYRVRRECSFYWDSEERDWVEHSHPLPDIVQINFESDRDLYYHMMAVKDDREVGEWWHTGNNFRTAIGNYDYDEIVVVVGGLGRGSDYAYCIEALTPTIEILGPTTEEPALVWGDPNPKPFWFTVRVTDQEGDSVNLLNTAWLNTGDFPSDFNVTVGLPGEPKLDACVYWAALEAPGTYLILVEPPSYFLNSEEQLCDLSVGIGDAVVTEPGAIDYGTGELESPELVMNLVTIPHLVFGLYEGEEERGWQGDPISIQVSITELGPVTDAFVMAEITTPPIVTPTGILPGETYSTPLYDDGQHEDGMVEDGLYGNIFSRTSRPGTYIIEARAEGFAPEFGSFVENITINYNSLPSQDWDEDGLPDWWEERWGLDANDSTGDQGADGDPDMDGLNNAEELMLGTSPIDSDTDSGGESDGSEVAAGRDPNDPSDDAIPCIRDFYVRPNNGFNLVYYSYKPEYQSVLIWRSTQAETGYQLIAEDFGLGGFYNDTNVENGLTYYYRITAKGPAGEVTAVQLPESATPKTDVDPPRGSVTINNGEETTESLDVRLMLRADPDTTQMMVSNDPRFTDAQWEPYQTSKDWRLDGMGLQTVYVRYRDAADNVAVEVLDSINVALEGDVNFDGIVDMVDITICALALWSYPGHARWNPIADIRKDGVIDIIDLVIIGVNFGNTV